LKIAKFIAKVNIINDR